jgi:cardiolipin synthase
MTMRDEGIALSEATSRSAPASGPFGTRRLSAAWLGLMAPVFVGGNQVRLLSGGDELFPAMCDAIALARHEVWLATYIFHDDEAGRLVAQALAAAGRRGVRVGVVVDGFGSKASLAVLRRWLAAPNVELAVFRRVDSWLAMLQPGQLRRLHHKLCAVDGECAFVGGVNLIADRFDLNHGRTELPRLDFAVELRGPVAASVTQTARAMCSRAELGTQWREEVGELLRSDQPLMRVRALARRLRVLPGRRATLAESEPGPVRAAFVVRDNLRRRRTIERAYIDAIRHATTRVDIACPYFYPGQRFRRALRSAAARGVEVRLLLQGKADYLIAALAAQVLYDELLGAGVRIFEYLPAFLHAKVALVDADWATVGSSNIDPLSLLLNLEANVIVRDADFSVVLAQRFEMALADSREVSAQTSAKGWRKLLRRSLIAWLAVWFLRLAGITGRY